MFRSAIRTFMPWPRHFFATARPMPEAPPVIRAVLAEAKANGAIVRIKFGKITENVEKLKLSTEQR